MLENGNHNEVTIGAPPGEHYTATVPDTLDLAERATLAVNALTNFRPDEGYAITQTYRFSQQPPMIGPPNWLTPKFLRTLPLVRLMCGSDQNLDAENLAWRAFLNQIHSDGLLYCPISGDGPPPNTSYPMFNGILAQALALRIGIDEDDVWMPWLQRLWGGLKRGMIDCGEYAYIPPECSLDSSGGWNWTLRGGGDAPGYLPYSPPDEPIHDSQGQEGTVKFEHAASIKALMQCYQMTGDEEALICARKLVKFCLKPALWSQETDDTSVPPHEHGQFTGHFHGNMGFLETLLHFALNENDSALSQVVREGYEHARRHGVIRLGFMPGWIKPMMGRDAEWSLEQNEGCGVADTLILAIRLTDTGLGDYWDDVDSMVRNHFAELQVTDIERMRRACGSDAYDQVHRQFLGGFTQAKLLVNPHSSVFGCCTANGNRALYTAWEGITRFSDGVATVNLLLNRAAPWMDIHSYLPYEGKVAIHNKQARVVQVRLPRWIDVAQLACYVNDKAIGLHRVGNNILFDGLAGGEKIRVEFPVPETTEQYTICGTRYTVSLRGNTVVDITPRESDDEAAENRYLFFQREHLKSRSTPMREVKRFVPSQVLPVQ